jgi:hypothetical protein
MKSRILFFLALLPLGLMAQKVIINDPNVAPRTVGAFHSIRVSNAIDLYLSQDETESLAVSALKEEYRDRIKTVVEDGVLKISFDNDRFNFSGNMKLRAYISFKDIKLIVASGASDVIATSPLSVDALTIDMSGASDFKGTLDIGTFTAKLSGASDARLNGKATTVTINASGASDVKAYELITDYCNVETSGASDVQITVNKELSAKASGASDVHYKGAAVVKNIQANGASSVKKRD